MKKCRLSPDSFVQMALQLAYFRDQRFLAFSFITFFLIFSSSFALTYESAMMRLFRDGRTETIRSLSLESVEFVKAMEDPKKTVEEKQRLHKLAVEAHNNYAKMASIGDGVDRHLFALYVVAMGTETEAKFLREALQVSDKLLGS
jgi:carnitine O-palmitoyltransferase 1